ncbi:ABC transporter substrate-binding protein [Glycomyces sp. L485]|uniref:ABC transporter substrate-binding protein n=1 Tax=Glycomyces sp. L485 TaxID=2909235 RepID=UPI001F4AD112|nr:ABC transporter substrate-binding protein [Glycomyces sp. L485]MCH7232960.1 ABC transporter substrate-binding protein [Glycomyces sp. L485]
MTLKRRALAGIATATAGALALSACGGGGDDDSASQGGDVTWAIASSFNNWYLDTSAGNSSYLRQILSPMLPTLGDFHPEDGSWVVNDAVVAEDPVLLSEAPMQVQIKLNPDANWGDGNPIRIEDFIYTWHQRAATEEFCDEKCDTVSAEGWAQIESIEEPEEGTVVITYEEGYADPEWLYTEYLRMPSHIAEENGFTDWATDPAQMGESVEWFASNAPTWSAGAYLPADAELGEFIRYEPNPDYAGSADPSLDSLTLEVIEDTESIITEARQGTIDGAWPNTFTMDQLTKLDDTQDVSYETYPGSIWIHLDINAENQFLSDQALRQAVFTAIDVNELIERNFQGIDGVSRKLNPFFTEGSPYYEEVPALLEQGTGDLDAARTLLEDADYTVEGDTLMSPDGEAVTFNFRFGGSDEIRKTIAELVQAQLGELGITVELNPIADNALGDVIGGKEFDMVIFGWSGNPAFVVAPNQFFGAESPYMFGPTDNAELQAAIEGVRNFDIDASAASANEAAKIAGELAVQLPILDEPQSIIVADYLENVGPNGNSQAGPLWNVQEWAAG